MWQEASDKRQGAGKCHSLAGYVSLLWCLQVFIFGCQQQFFFLFSFFFSLLMWPLMLSDSLITVVGVLEPSSVVSWDWDWDRERERDWAMRETLALIKHVWLWMSTAANSLSLSVWVYVCVYLCVCVDSLASCCYTFQRAGGGNGRERLTGAQFTPRAHGGPRN